MWLAVRTVEIGVCGAGPCAPLQARPRCCRADLRHPAPRRCRPRHRRGARCLGRPTEGCPPDLPADLAQPQPRQRCWSPWPDAYFRSAPGPGKNPPVDDCPCQHLRPGPRRPGPREGDGPRSDRPLRFKAQYSDTTVMRDREDPTTSRVYDIEIVCRRVPDIVEELCEFYCPHSIKLVKTVPIEKHVVI